MTLLSVACRFPKMRCRKPVGVLEQALPSYSHPYTSGLIGSVPSHNARGKRLAQIPGMTPSLLNLPDGCPFKARCPRAGPACDNPPPTEELAPGHFVRCFNPMPDNSGGPARRSGQEFAGSDA